MKDIKESLFLKFQRYSEKEINKKNDGRLVFMFHHVTDHKENWYDERYSMSLESFKNIIEWCKYNGYIIIPPQDILKSDGKKKVLLTFDDAFKEIYTEVFPYLQTKGYPYIVFPSIQLMENEQYVSPTMLCTMKGYKGCYVGAHTVSHCKLREESAARSKTEIVKSKEILEDMLGEDVECMAYPYGTYYAVGRKDKRIVEENYAYAFSTLQACVTEGVDRYFIPRINMNESNWKNNLERYKL